MQEFETVIIGGSYAGLSAALSLGRARRHVLIIDSGQPCNRQTPHSHNFLTRDGSTPAELHAIAKKQLASYPTVQFVTGQAIEISRKATGWQIARASGEVTVTKTIILATGVRDQLPNINGIAECWGISVIHCPYCHGYEFSNKSTGIIANGETAFELAKLISQWTAKLTVFSNGASQLSSLQLQQLSARGIEINEEPIKHLLHEQGYVREIILENDAHIAVDAIYIRPSFTHDQLVSQLQLITTATSRIQVDMMQRTNIEGIWACGDNCSPMRSVANAVATGSMAGASLNKMLIEKNFS